MSRDVGVDFDLQHLPALDDLLDAASSASPPAGAHRAHNCHYGALMICPFCGIQLPYCCYR